jgi:hypothetical protein
MTSTTDIVNRALQCLGTRTTVTDAELAASSTNEAIQANLNLYQLRDDLLRMAPWDCALKTANLTYISSVPGTPENTSAATPLWEPGQPAPPWAYEFQYPVDCLRACWIIPANQTGFAGGIPITTAVIGGAAAFWRGMPIKFKVQNDAFYPVTAAAVVNGGSGYAVGDIITAPVGLSTNPPIGAPVQLRVTTAPGGVIGTVDVVNVINGAIPNVGGSYFAPQANPIVQGTTTGVGTGATFNLTYGAQSDQRVILTNQEFATLAYVKQVIDPNVMDTMFQSAWSNLLGAYLSMALVGDKKRANDLVAMANRSIEEARAVDGNEGLTINDVTPDWIRTRGIAYTEGFNSGPYSGYDWGSSWPSW